MGSRARTPRPGEPQFRRLRFCLRLLGLWVVFTFVSAIVIGIPFQGLWSAVLVPFILFSLAVLLLFTTGFFLRGLWFKSKAKHYATLAKLASDPDFR